MRHCAERLLRYMVPKGITLLTRLAKSLTGKTHRTSLLTGRKIASAAPDIDSKTSLSEDGELDRCR